MINKEKVIKGLTLCTTINKVRPIETCKKCHYFIRDNEPDAECIDMLMLDALELLKEQEPMKPTVAVDTWICSNCGHALESQTLIDDKENPQVLVNEQYNFCPQCGKAVKWE